MTTKQLFQSVRGNVFNITQFRLSLSQNIKYFRIGLITAVFVFSSMLLIFSDNHTVAKENSQPCPIASLSCIVTTAPSQDK